MDTKVLSKHSEQEFVNQSFLKTNAVCYRNIWNNTLLTTVLGKLNSMSYQILGPTLGYPSFSGNLSQLLSNYLERHCVNHRFPETDPNCYQHMWSKTLLFTVFWKRFQRLIETVGTQLCYPRRWKQIVCLISKLDTTLWQPPCSSTRSQLLSKYLKQHFVNHCLPEIDPNCYQNIWSKTLLITVFWKLILCVIEAFGTTLC